MKWIKCSDRVPCTFEGALLIDDIGDMHIGYWGEDANAWDSNQGWIKENITHWMPLPAPPKRKGE